MNGEFDLIDHVFRDLTVPGDDILRGIGDDCALVQTPADQAVAVTTDTLVEGVHYPKGTAAADVGWKALACSLSDLAAKGADPAWATLALGLPDPDYTWSEAFASGFAELARREGVTLIGGDIVRAPVATITVQLAGYIPPDAFIARDGATVGDRIFVSGWPGEAAAALERGAEGAAMDLRDRLNRPEPRVALGRQLRARASAGIDVSDGLLADLGRMLRASGVGARLRAAALPASAALQRCGHREEVLRWILYGGDDYELCFCAPLEQSPAIKDLTGLPHPITAIGAVENRRGVVLVDDDGREQELAVQGYEHFGGAGARR